VHGAALLGAAPLPPSRARHTLERAAQLQRTLRGKSLELLELAGHEGRSAEWLAERLGISATTLRRWHTERDAGKVEPDVRGARPFRASPGVLRALLECVEEFALMGVRALHRARPGIPRRWLEWLAARLEERHERRAWRGELVWTRPGAVWAMDHTELDKPIDGEFRFLFVVRDLASGLVLTALPTRSTDQSPVVAELERLFELHGAPLVLKSDNGSGLVGEDVQDALERWQVTALRSPPGTPSFNGAVEAGMGSLKGLIAEIAAQHGRISAWTSDDVHAALLVQRRCGGSRGASSSPEDAWRARTPIAASERDAFLDALRAARESLLRDSPPSPIIERRAVRTVLTDLDYLLIRRP
jgi:transposase InsO family protein